MKIGNQTFFLFSVLTLTLCLSCKEVEDIKGCDFPTSLEAYQLVWSDEFDGTEIDGSKWTYEIGDGCDRGPGLCGWGNNELQYYTDLDKNAFISDGKLVIQSVKENPLYLNKYEYTSARLVTKNKGDWKYGRIDVRAKMPIGKGLWPAAWMLPTDNVYGIWPKSGEIDIVEYLGDKPSEVIGTIHYGHDFHRFNTQHIELESGTFADDFHVFTAIWTEDCILFRMDGKDIGVPNTRSTVYPTTWPFDQAFHMILNIAVGGNLPGNPDASTQFPQRMEVDYIRVYQEK